MNLRPSCALDDVVGMSGADEKADPFRFVDLTGEMETPLLAALVSPELEPALREMYDAIFATDWKEGVRDKAMFRGTEAEGERLARSDKPWLLAPLATIAYVGSRDGLTAVFADDIKPETEESAREEREEREAHAALVLAATGPDRIAWWSLQHECAWINGSILCRALSVAFPARRFVVADNEMHTWVFEPADDVALIGALDLKRGKHYCLTWPFVDVTSVASAIQEGGPVFFAIEPLAFPRGKRVRDELRGVGWFTTEPYGPAILVDEASVAAARASIDARQVKKRWTWICILLLLACVAYVAVWIARS